MRYSRYFALSRSLFLPACLPACPPACLPACLLSLCCCSSSASAAAAAAAIGMLHKVLTGMYAATYNDMI